MSLDIFTISTNGFLAHRGTFSHMTDAQFMTDFIIKGKYENTRNSIGGLPAKLTIPDFKDAHDLTTVNGVDIVVKGDNTMMNVGAKDAYGSIVAYCRVTPEGNMFRLREIYTVPGHTGKGYAKSLLQGVLSRGIPLLLAKSEPVSNDARGLIGKLVKDNTIKASFPDGTALSYNELWRIFNIMGDTNYEIVLS